MTVTVWDYDGAVFFEGTFDNLAEAEEAGKLHERLVTNGAKAADLKPLDQILLEMDDDALLAELFA
jgi:hypothetical protein